MRGSFWKVSTLTAAMLLSVSDGAAHEPPVPMAAVTSAPAASGQMAWEPDGLPKHPSPEVMVSRVVVRSEAEPIISEAHPPATERATEDDGGFEPVIDEDVVLLPIWHYGFWAMPPGGLTRHLLPPRVPIDPDETLASVSVTVKPG